MANVDGPQGLTPINTLDGSCIKTREYQVDVSNGLAIGIGDLIVFENDGNVSRGAASPTAGTVVGVSASVLAATTAGTIQVYDNPSIIYVAQTDNGTGTATSQTAVNLNINLVSAAPSNGISTQELDEDSANTTSTLVFRILGLHREVGNAFGEFNKLDVIINPHAYKSVGTAGV